MTKFKRILMRSVSMLGASCMLFGFCAANLQPDNSQTLAGDGSGIRQTNYSIDTKLENYFDPDVVFKLPETVASNDDISVIVSLDSVSVMDAYNAANTTKSLSQFVQSSAAKDVASDAAKAQDQLIKQLKKAKVNHTVGARYDTILNGFEITIKAKDFKKVGKLFGDSATLILGETYMPAEVEKVVTNEVVVHDTGIFDSSESQYQGDGVVVAVLDTGLDYTHTAFSPDNFTSSDERFTLSNIAPKLEGTWASKATPGLTAQDVFVSKKVPYAYDYADKDPDVLPISSEHGTHVAGIIAGNDNMCAVEKHRENGQQCAGGKEDCLFVKGVAPNAQLAIMKVFSDMQGGAKSAWILDALEDCTKLGVDVINMSLGAGCGFAREVDKERVNDVYDAIKEAGISLIVAAGNDYIATMGSEKNGSLNLTRNPDAGTVGSPSTYEASLCVASVDGVKTPYFKYGDEIIYFNEAHTSSAKTKDFIDDLLTDYSELVGYEVNEHTFEYVTIPNIGELADYEHDKSYYEGKIVLVRRGISMFEEKVRIALEEKGAIGIMIYNNISGAITMSVGKDVGAVCSLTQDDGEKLAQSKTGYITIGRGLTAGPFMSDFSSWGPSSDLQIKPEITAHGGEILSAVPGQGYDRLSGTSMATPNQAGATALIRQYVRYSGNFGDYSGTLTNAQAQEVTAIVNQLMMSTADIVYNKNGLPFAVRKQGAGLVNIMEATTAESYLISYDKQGKLMDRTKLEIGDDKDRTGVYTMKFLVKNISNTDTSYNLSAMIMSEGVSQTYTSHGDTTVSQDGKMLDGTVTKVTKVNGVTATNNFITVSARGEAVVEVEIRLSEADKTYLKNSFENGMYVEGFITLEAVNGASVDLSIPVLGFFGSWLEAPIFDEEYYDTNKDELSSMPAEDQLMADAYPTKVSGKLYSEYVAMLGQYYFAQDPTAKKIPASKEHISISNQENGKSSAVNSVEGLWAGLLRNAKEAQIKIVEDATGKTIFEHTEYNIRKSNGVSGISPAFIDIEFSALEHQLKNNTKYTVTVTTYIDYGTHAEQDKLNVRNVFEFPLFIDFQAPAVTGVTYRTEYDKDAEINRLYADLTVYDNHYAMGVQFGQVLEAAEDSDYTFDIDTFGKYIQPVYSNINSSSIVTVELTDHISRLKDSVSMDPDGKVLNKSNTFIAICYDYALNSSMFEITLPDEVVSMYFNQTQIELNPNETKSLNSLLEIYPMDTWMEILDFESSDTSIIDVVNQTVVAKASGTAVVTAIGYDADGKEVRATLNVKVRAPGDPGYDEYDVTPVDKFELVGYKVNKAYYSVSGDDRDIGLTNGVYNFGGDKSLSMYPSESVTLSYRLNSNFPDKTTLRYSVANSKIASISEDGTLVALKEGTTRVTLTVYFDGVNTRKSQSVYVTVKDPYKTQGMYLMSYKGLGGVVEIPGDRGIEIIQTYAFSNYEYVDKGPEDIIDDDDPYMIKQMYIGEDTITKVIIPEGVTSIEAYAFANLSKLEEVVLPKSLVKIGVGAFLNCKNLKKVNLESVKFINKEAFANTKLEEAKLDSVVAIGNYSFQNASITAIELPSTSESIGVGSFMGNKYLESVTFSALKMKIGESAFEDCAILNDVVINAAVISKKAFYNCKGLTNVTIGKEVQVIGEYAFANTNVSKFNVQTGGQYSKDAGGAILLHNGEVVLVAPMYDSTIITLTNATSIATGAFSSNKSINRVVANKVEVIGSYAFAGCSNLKSVEFSALQQIGDYAFFGTALTQTPDLSSVSAIGKYAFASSALTSVTIPTQTSASKLTIGEYAFANCHSLRHVTIGDNVEVGAGAFSSEIEYNDLLNFQTDDKSVNITIKDYLSQYYTKYIYEVKDENGNVVKEHNYYHYDINVGAKSTLESVVIGDNVTLGNHAFDGNTRLSTLSLGLGTKLGEYAFYNAIALTNVDLTGVEIIGDYAFSGERILDLWWPTGKALNVAYEQKYENDRVVYLNYIYNDYVPVINEVRLDNVKYVGKYAFANNPNLTKVIISGQSTVEVISEGAFGNTPITELVLPNTVKTIGDYAFYQTKFSTLDLSSVTEIGKFAFYLSELTQVTLAENAQLGDDAFNESKRLATVNNLDKVSRIGARAFLKTAVSNADIRSATFVGDFAFGETKVTSVIFGEKLVEVKDGNNKKLAVLGAKVVELGENPFYGCNITTFAMENTIDFAGVEIKEMVTTYDISDTIKVIDDVIYQVVPNGLELINYPMGKTLKDYSVLEDTVRITARAFYGSAIETVTLPTTLKSLGDRAFYGCKDLSVVVFKGYEAPFFEEEYKSEYVTVDELPFTGSLRVYEGEDPVSGLGIVPFYMWNATSGWNNFYFGATFVDRVGHTERDLVMVKPVNGQNYDSFVASQYFGLVVSGDTAATQATLNVISMINALPKNIQLSHKAMVQEAYAAYNNLATDQQALVKAANYDVLSNAMAMIEAYEYREPSTQPTDPTPTPPEEDNNVGAVVAIVILSVVVAGLAVFIVLDKFVLKKKAVVTENAEN